jgi:hypothetical protein
MFVFECNTHNKDCLVLFLGQYVSTASKFLTSSIQNAYKENLTPEIVFFIYPAYLENEIALFIKNENSEVDLTRHQFSPVVCISFDVKGNFLVTYRLNDAEYTPIDCPKLQLDVIKSGYDNLMQKRSSEVLVKAPAGTTFVKPSGKNLEEFIYASQLARCNDEYQFLAMSLLRHSPNLDTIDCIYIDTSSISTIAESVIYYLTKFQGGICKHTTFKSFSSYSGLEEVGKPDNTTFAWVIISASATTSMGKKLVKDWNIKPEQVVTILSYQPLPAAEDINTGNAIVFCLDEYSTRDKKSFSPTKVQVQGESFSAEVSNPEKALLLKKYKPGFIDSCVYEYRNEQVFSANKSAQPSQAVHPIFVNYQNLRNYYYGKVKRDNKLYWWIKQVVQWTIPRNLSAIIVDSEIAPELFADFKDVLTECEFDMASISKLKPDDQIKMQSIDEGSVLVLSPAISTGRFFVDVNRELRLAKHKGMRVFATPFVVAPSRDQFKTLSISLTQGTNGFKYDYVSFNRIYAGGRGLSSWDKELDLIKELINEVGGDAAGAKYWMDRKDTLEKQGEGLNGKIGLNYSDSNKSLELAKDFVFWPEGYEKYDAEAVYATVASVLQNLRDNQIDGCRLSANIYQHCVLDPENFVRFNDPILQSCLWRCAMPGELDYRRSDALSDDIQRVLKKIFMSCDSARGVTSLDFLMGLATRWIKISNDSMKKVIANAELYLKNPQAILLIEYMKKEFKI